MHFIIKKNPEAKTKLEQWLWLLAEREDKLEMAKKENKSIEKAMKIIEEISLDEKEWELYRSRQMAIMDYNVGISTSREEGKAEGKKEKQVEIAKKLLELGIHPDDIEKATGLTKEEIKKL